MDISVFTDKSTEPTNAMLKNEIGDEMYVFWNEIESFTFQVYQKAEPEWKYTGKNFGWSRRIKDKKRVIVYLLPREKYFKTALVYGEKAYQEVMNSPVNDSIKHELTSAKAYADGRGIRIDIRTAEDLIDIKELIRIKIMN